MDMTSEMEPLANTCSGTEVVPLDWALGSDAQAVRRCQDEKMDSRSQSGPCGKRLMTGERVTKKGADGAAAVRIPVGSFLASSLLCGNHHTRKSCSSHPCFEIAPGLDLDCEVARWRW
ncbi:hypothetical protein CLAIMM_09914 isoform 2, partial [Cladophialophora immunda]